MLKAWMSRVILAKLDNLPSFASGAYHLSNVRIKGLISLEVPGKLPETLAFDHTFKLLPSQDPYVPIPYFKARPKKDL